MSRAPLVLLLLTLALPLRATWHTFSTNSATAVDFRNAHQGLISMNDATHLIQVYQDANVNGVFQAPDVVTALIIQDSLVAWATVKGNGLYRGTKHWSTWKQISSRTDLALVASITDHLFVYSLGQLYYTSDGLNLNATNGIPKGDSIVAMDHLSDQLLFAASQIAVYRSTDAGQNWNPVLTGILGCHSLYADAQNNIVYAGGDTIRKSKDGGSHWVSLQVPPPFTWGRVTGYIIGAHDCSGTFYLTDTTGFDYNMVRSTDGGRTFEDVGNTPQLASPVRKAWTFDRGSTMWWWDWTTGKGAANLASSDDGLNGAITKSIAYYVIGTADEIYDTACGDAKPLTIKISSEVCTPVRLDSVFASAQLGKIAKAAIGVTLQGDATTISLNYTPLVAGVDTITLRVTLHGIEWAMPEEIDLSTIAHVSNEPAKLAPISDLDFGSVRTDSAKTLTLILKNSGCNALRVDSIASTNPNVFAVDLSSPPWYVKADSTLRVPVRYSPQAAGLSVESIEIGTNAGHEFVTVQGNGVRVVSSVSHQEHSRVEFYPNPVSNVLHATARVEIDIFDMLGRRVLNAAGDTFDVSTLPEGSYFVRVQDRTIPIVIARP